MKFKYIHWKDLLCLRLWLLLFPKLLCVDWRWCVICINYWAVCHGLRMWHMSRSWSCHDFGGCGSLGGSVAHMMVDRVALKKDHVNLNIVGGIITSLRSAGRNLVALNGYNWLILTLLPLVILLMLLRPLFLVLLVLSLWYFHRLSMVDWASSSSLRTTIQ